MIGSSDWYFKLPDTCRAMRSRNLDLSFSLTFIEPGSDITYNILLHGDEMMVDDVNPGDPVCYLPIMKQRFVGVERNDIYMNYTNTWILGTYVMNKYYTIYDQRDPQQPRIGIALKDRLMN